AVEVLLPRRRFSDIVRHTAAEAVAPLIDVEVVVVDEGIALRALPVEIQIGRGIGDDEPDGRPDVIGPAPDGRVPVHELTARGAAGDGHLAAIRASATDPRAPPHD